MRNASMLTEVRSGGRKPADGARRPARPIDMLHLARQSMGDPGLELEILRMFDQIVAVHFARLERATSVPDLLAHLHTIKAGAAGVGAWSLAEHAHIMERELLADMPVNPERVEDIHISVEEVRAFIAGQVALEDVTSH